MPSRSCAVVIMENTPRAWTIFIRHSPRPRPAPSRTPKGSRSTATTLRSTGHPGSPAGIAPAPKVHPATPDTGCHRAARAQAETGVWGAEGCRCVRFIIDQASGVPSKKAIGSKSSATRSSHFPLRGPFFRSRRFGLHIWKVSPAAIKNASFAKINFVAQLRLAAPTAVSFDRGRKGWTVGTDVCKHSYAGIDPRGGVDLVVDLVDRLHG